MTKEVKLLRVHARIRYIQRGYSAGLFSFENKRTAFRLPLIYTLLRCPPIDLITSPPRHPVAPPPLHTARPPPSSTAHPPSSRPASRPHPHTMAETSAQQEYPNLNPYTDADADSMNANGAPAPAPALSNGPSATEQGKSAVSSKVRDTSPVPSCPPNILFPSVCQ